MKHFLIALILISLTSCSPDSSDTEEIINEIKACFTSISVTTAGESVTFNSSCSANASSYLWSFGDGNTSTDENPVHIFTQSGNYAITLTLNNEEITHTESIVVNEATIDNSGMSHSGFITEDETWIEGTHLVTGLVFLQAKLTIEPGAIIKFQTGASILISESNTTTPTIMAIGTTTKPITFTSSQTSPSAGDWGTICLGASTAENPAVFDYCVFEYGGGSQIISENTPLVCLMNGARGSFDNSIFRYSGGYGIEVDKESRFTGFDNNNIYNINDYAMHIAPVSIGGIEKNNNIDNKGIYVSFSNIDENVTWNGQTCPFVTEGSLSIGANEGAALTLNEGVVIAFEPRTGIRGASSSVSAAIYVNGTQENPVIFETNTNSSATDKWSGVVLNEAFASDSYFHYTEFRDAQQAIAEEANDAIIYVDGATLNMENCTVMTGKSYGIRLTDSAELNTFSNNDIGAVDTYSMYIRGKHIGNFDTGNTFSGNKDIYAIGITNIDTEVTWLALDVYYLISGDINIGSSSETEASLTISPGLKMSGNINIGKTYVSSRASTIDAPGSLIAIGEPNNPILIEKKDGLSNDVIIEFSSQTGSSSIISNCVIDGAGLSTLGIRINHLDNDADNPYPIISNNTISNMRSYPIQFTSSSPIIENNTYLDNGTNEVNTF